MGNDEKVDKYLKKYHLEELTNKNDIDSVKKIVFENLGTGLIETGMTFSFTAKSEDMLQVYYLRTIMEQNFIMIRQLERISKQNYYFKSLIPSDGVSHILSPPLSVPLHACSVM